MAYLSGKSNWDYLKILVGPKFRVGMSEHDMLMLLAGPDSRPDESVYQLLKKWLNSPAPPSDSLSHWDELRIALGKKFHPDDSTNNMLRALAAAL